MKKIAFLFLTRKNHNCEELWNIFFDNVPREYYNIYNHYKEKPNQFFLRNNSVKQIIPTQWAHISLVKATIILLKEAYADHNNVFFILLSDSCVPLINFKELRNYLLFYNKPIIHFKHLKNKYPRYIKLHPLIKNKIPFHHFYTQHQWMILTKPYVKLLLVNDFTKYFKNMDVPDEHYFISVFFILNKYKEIFNNKTTYCNWDNMSLHPKMYNNLPINFMNYLKNNHFLFLRKVSNDFSLSDTQKLYLRSNFNKSILNTITEK